MTIETTVDSQRDVADVIGIRGAVDSPLTVAQPPTLGQLELSSWQTLTRLGGYLNHEA